MTRSDHSKRRRRRVIGAVLAVASMAAVAAGCGDDKKDSTASTPSTSDAAPASTPSSSSTASSAGSSSTASSTASSASSGAGEDALAPKPLAKTEKVTVAVAGYKAEGFSALYVADKLGEFKKENLDVSVTVINPADAVVAIDSGKVDVYAAGFLANLFNAVRSGSDLHWIASVHWNPPTSRMGFWARTDLMKDGKLDPCDIKGKTVSLGGATGYAGSGSWSMADYLAKCNLTLKDFTLSTLGGADLVVAMENGAVDVGFLADPAWLPLEQSGKAALAIPAYPEPLGGYIVGKMIKDRPEALDAFVRAMARVVRDDLQGDYKKNKDVLDALASSMDIPAEKLGQLPNLIFRPDMKIDPKPIDDMQKIWFNVGDILTGEPIPASQIIDNSVLDRVFAGT